jgi:hypothetical protein
VKNGTWGLIGLFVLCWIAGAFTSRGFLEDDAWAHYLYSRAVWKNPAYLFDVWGRPVCTGVYALAAPWGGMLGCRFVSLLLVLAGAELMRRVAIALGIDPRASVAFLLAQPVLYLHSLSVMTELPFAVLLIAAFLAYLRRRWWLMALLVGLLPLARPEGFGFVCLAIGALVMRRRTTGRRGCGSWITGRIPKTARTAAGGWCSLWCCFRSWWGSECRLW